ncbi:MAG: hypothetical protein JSV58_06805 [Candidatus Bathyarchaeota archaeon]|nr:MAG: hypothetical protein JSV58_06805 [Candidatus Bathyarchaeota archaeon]
MPVKRRKKEVLVDTSVLKRREEKILKDTTASESFNVFRISRRFGRLVGRVLAAIGVLFLILSSFILLTEAPFSFFSSEPPLLIILGSVGAMNVLGGLLLLAKE